MAKRIIVLDRPNPTEYRYALWADVPVGRQKFYADGNKVSAYLDISPAELTALRSGAIVERVDSFSSMRKGANGLVPLTFPQAQAILQQAWQRFQDEINASAADNPWQRYGTSWDGNSWTPGGVA